MQVAEGKRAACALVQPQESCDGVVDERARAQRRRAVPPEQLAERPPAAGVGEGEHEGGAVPDAEVGGRECARAESGGEERGEVVAARGGEEVRVGRDEDRGAELGDEGGGRREYCGGGRPPADVRGAVIDGDV